MEKKTENSKTFIELCKEIDEQDDNIMIANEYVTKKDVSNRFAPYDTRFMNLKPKPEKRKLFIAIEGNIGSGKSDVINCLNNKGFITEQQDVKKMNELLKKYYENSTKKGECLKLQQLVFDMYKDQCKKHDLLLGDDKKKKVYGIKLEWKNRIVENRGRIDGAKIKLDDLNVKFDIDEEQLKLSGVDKKSIEQAKKEQHFMHNAYKNMPLDAKMDLVKCLNEDKYSYNIRAEPTWSFGVDIKETQVGLYIKPKIEVRPYVQCSISVGGLFTVNLRESKLKTLPKEEKSNVVFTEGPMSNFDVFTKMEYHDKHLSLKEFKILEAKYSPEPIGMIPDAIVLLKPPPKVCLERIKKRNRKNGESNIKLDYLKRIDEYYNEFIEKVRCPVFILKNELTTKENAKLIEHFVADIIDKK